MEHSKKPDSSQLKKVQELKSLIEKLKQQIAIEKDLWTQEIWEYNRLRRQLLGQLQEKYHAEVAPTTCLIDVRLPSVKGHISQHVSSSIDNMQASQAKEMKYQSMRRLAANAYRERLLEVEQLCQLELNRVKENAAYLEPLKGMVSSWHDSPAIRGLADDNRPPMVTYRDLSSGDHPEQGCKTDPATKQRLSSLTSPLR